jgi:hypothetical protein
MGAIVIISIGILVNLGQVKLATIVIRLIWVQLVLIILVF